MQKGEAGKGYVLPSAFSPVVSSPQKHLPSPAQAFQVLPKAPRLEAPTGKSSCLASALGLQNQSNGPRCCKCRENSSFEELTPLCSPSHPLSAASPPACSMQENLAAQEASCRAPLAGRGHLWV